MNKIIGEILFEGEFIKAEDYKPKDNYVYEVVRIIKSEVLFFDDHFTRLFDSLQLAFNCGQKSGFDYIRNNLNYLISKNNITNGNIRVDAYFEENLKLFFYQIEAVYPNEEQYSKGVNTVFQFSERNNPNAKIGNYKLKNKAKELINKNNIYETILVNKRNEITEGSRSNLFFIKGKTIISPPSHKILKGITRHYLIKVIKELEFEFEEKTVKLYDLSKYDSVFLSGTSPIILPIKNIENLNFDVNNKVLRKLMDEFIPRVLNYKKP